MVQVVETVDDLIKVVNGIKSYYPRHFLHTEERYMSMTELIDWKIQNPNEKLKHTYVSFWRKIPKEWYDLGSQLDAIDKLGKTGSKKALRFLRKLIRYATIRETCQRAVKTSQ